MVKPLAAATPRQREITRNFEIELDKHLEDIKNGKSDTMFEIHDFAELLHIHPRHLSNTVYKVTGRSPCFMFENKLMDLSRELLLSSGSSVAEIARRLTFDPSNFTKFFKRFSGMTPKAFRNAYAESALAMRTEEAR